MKALGAAVVGLVALAGAVRADEAQLVGKWEVTKSGGETPVGTAVEFAAGGKLTATVPVDGKELKLGGTYKLEGKRLKLTLKLNEQELAHEFAATFKADTLELEDAEKKVDVLTKKK